MKRVLFAIGIIASLMSTAFSQEHAVKVTLLGTAGPEYFSDRLGISTLVQVNGHNLLFDIGRGTNQRLYQSRINPKDITDIFVTHLHSDHIEGLPDLWMTPWFLLGRDHGFDLWGPKGTQEMVAGMKMMFGHDLEKRVNKFNPVENLEIVVHPLQEGLVFDKDGVKVTAFPVEHSDGNPAYGFKVEADGHSVILSGDTTLNDNVIKYGRGADLIVHNVIAFSDRLSQMPEMQGVLAKLTTPEQAAKVFSETKPKMAVYSHLVTKELQGTKGEDQIMARTRAAGYEGPLTMGVDRMAIEISDEVKIVPPTLLEDLPNLDSKGQTFP